MRLSKIFHAAAGHLPAPFSAHCDSFASYLKAHEEKRAFISALGRNLKSGAMTQEDVCWLIAESVHGHTFRNDGSPTMDHINGVYNAPELYADIEYTDKQRILAIVHDVVEDSIWTVKDFKKLGFDDEFCDGLDAMTRRAKTFFRAKEKYFDNAERVAGTIALAVKDGDNRYNWAHNPKPGKADRYRVTSHYYRACHFGVVEKGSSIVEFAVNQGLYNESLFAEHSTKPLIPNYSPPLGKEHMAGVPVPAAI